MAAAHAAATNSNNYTNPNLAPTYDVEGETTSTQPNLFSNPKQVESTRGGNSNPIPNSDPNSNPTASSPARRAPEPNAKSDQPYCLLEHEDELLDTTATRPVKRTSPPLSITTDRSTLLRRSETVPHLTNPNLKPYPTPNPNLTPTCDVGGEGTNTNSTPPANPKQVDATRGVTSSSDPNPNPNSNLAHPHDVRGENTSTKPYQAQQAQQQRQAQAQQAQQQA